MNKVITQNQLGILMFFIILTNKLLILPSIIYQDLQVNAIVCVAAMLFLDMLVCIVALCYSKKYKDVGFAELLKSKLGKVLSIIVFTIFAIFICAKFIFLFNETFTFLKQLVYEEYEYVLFLILFCFVCCIVCNNGLGSIAKTCEIIFAIVAVCMFIVLLSSFYSSAISPSLPYFLWDGKIAFGIYKYIFYFSDSILLFLFIGKIKYKTNSIKIPLCYLVVSIAVVLLFYIMFIFNYPITGSLHQNAIVDLTKFVPIISDVTSLDIFAITAQSIMSFMQGALMLWAITYLLSSVAPKIKCSYVCVSVAFVMAIISNFVVFNLEIATMLSVTGFNIASIVLIFLFVMFFLIMLRRGTKNER